MATFPLTRLRRQVCILAGNHPVVAIATGESEAVQNKRNVTDYVRIGDLSESAVAEILALAKDICRHTREWLIENYPDLVSGDWLGNVPVP